MRSFVCVLPAVFRSRCERLRRAAEQVFQYAPFAGIDRVEKLVGIAHVAEGVEAAFEKGVQVAKAGEMRRAAHELEQRREQRFARQPVECLAGGLDQVDLPFAVGSPADLAVSLGVRSIADRVDGLFRLEAAGFLEFDDHRRVELLAQRVDLDGERERLHRRERQDAQHQGHDALDFLVAAAEVLGSVQVRQEEVCRLAETLARQQVEVGPRQAGGLPFAQDKTPARGFRRIVRHPAQHLGGVQMPAQLVGAVEFVVVVVC